MNIKNVEDYFPGMDIIDSKIKEEIDTIYENVSKDEVTNQDITAAIDSDSLTYRDFYTLLTDNAANFIEAMADKAYGARMRYFGNNVTLFSPIYIANYCENSCKYCGFRAQSDIKRAKLTLEEIEAEMAALAATGIEDVLILTGESEKFSSIDYIACACEIAKKYFKVIGIEIYPTNIDGYKKLKDAGADFVTVFQESYNKEIYDFYHPAGHKRSFSYRIDTQERAIMAGMRGVGFGSLFGLGDPVEETFKLGVHASLIQKKYPHAEIAISLPRIRPAKGADTSLNFKNIVSDKQFLQILFAIRMFLPYASITLSTRESRDFRNLAVKYAATKISASVDTSIGNRSKYSSHSGGNQFEIDDLRTTDDVIRDLTDIGMTPVFTDYINV